MDVVRTAQKDAHRESERPIQADIDGRSVGPAMCACCHLDNGPLVSGQGPQRTRKTHVHFPRNDSYRLFDILQ